MIKLCLLCLCMFGIAHGARIPEALIRDQYISSEGYSLNFKDSSWLRSEPPGNIKNKMDVLFRSSEKDSQSTLSVRVDIDESTHSLKDYVGKWLKSYSQFKMDVLGHKYFKTNNEEQGFVVDVKSSPEKRVRQVIFFRNSKAVVFTCTDGVKSFSNTLKSCNDVIKTFVWIEKERGSSSPQNNI